MPSSSALACAPSFILTKKGLVSVLVIRQAEIVLREGRARGQRRHGRGRQQPALQRS